MDSQIISLNEELQEMREKYNELRNGKASKNHLNDDTPMCERHEANYIQSEDYQNRNSYDLFSHQSLNDPNDFEKSLTELNNDVRNDLEYFKRRIRSMRTVYWKLYDNDNRKTTGVLPNKKSKPINQEPQSKTNFEKLMTKFLDGQRVTNMFFKNNVNDMILKMKQNEKNFQTKIKNMKRKIDEWEKSQNLFSKQIDRTNPPPPLQAQTEYVNAIFTGSGKSDDSLKIKKDPLPFIINKIKKDRPIKTSKKDYQVVKTEEYPFPLAFSVEIPNVSQEQEKCARGRRSFVPALVIAVSEKKEKRKRKRNNKVTSIKQSSGTWNQGSAIHPLSLSRFASLTFLSRCSRRNGHVYVSSTSIW
ncbi:hypothetical protein Tco_0324181 [Tanacetum coccineum]